MKKVYRLTSVILLVALLSVFMCLPVSAEDLEGSADIYYLAKTNVFPNGTSSSYSLAYPLSSSAVSLSSLGGKGEYAQWSIPYLNVPLTDVAETVIVSFSYALGVACSTKVDASSAGWSYSFPVTSSPSATIEYTNHFGNQGFGNVDEIYTFSFAGGKFGSWGNEYWRSDGLSTVASFYGDELHPISNLKILWPEQYYTYITKTNSNRTVYDLLYVTSFRVISSGAPSADLAELQGIASQIAQSNEILSAIYG